MRNCSLVQQLDEERARDIENVCRLNRGDLRVLRDKIDSPARGERAEHIQVQRDCTSR